MCHGLLVKPWLRFLYFDIIFPFPGNGTHGSRVASNPWHVKGESVLRTFAKPRVVVSRCLEFARLPV